MAASTEPKVGVNRKRKKEISAENESSLKSKGPRKEIFTEIDFKFLLSNAASIFSGFERFILAAEQCADGEYDIVQGYCRSSPECEEIFKVLEAGKRKMNELQLIFSCLEKILLRIADDLNDKFFSCGQTIVRKITANHISALTFGLSFNHKSSQIKATVKLLIAMAMLGPFAIRLLLTHFDLSNEQVISLFNRRDIKDEEDVRTCMIHLVVGLLLSGDNESIRKLVEFKGLFPSLFMNMVYDRVSTIQLVLSTVLQKVVQNPTVSKTSKVWIFKEETLQQLGKLYKWRGPQYWKESLQKQSKKHAELPEVDLDEEGQSDRAAVAKMVHQLLLDVCASYKHGIVFMDKSYGLSRNQNHILTDFISSLSTMYKDALVQDLITHCLKACPDQLRYITPSLAHAPHASSRWVESVNFLHRIYDSLPRDPHVLLFREEKSMSDLVAVLLVYTLPPQPVLRTLQPAVKDKSLAVNHTMFGLVKLICERVVSLLTQLDKAWTSGQMSSRYNWKEYQEIVTQFTDTVLKSLPQPAVMFQIWDKVLKIKPKEEVHQELLALCAADVTDVKVRILQVLCLHQELTPALLMDNPISLGKLLDVISKDGTAAVAAAADDDDDEAGSRLLQMCLLKLLSGTEARRLPWGRKNQSGQSLMHQLLEMVVKASRRPGIQHLTQHLVCKLLAGTGLFDGCHGELESWVRWLQIFGSDPKTGPEVLKFVARVVLHYLQNPYPYMDRVSDLVSKVILEHSGKADNSTGLEEKIETILSMDIGDLNDDKQSYQTTCASFPFSPMLVVAMDTIKEDSSVSPGVQMYLTVVVLDTFHLQIDPVPLVTMVTGNQADVFNPDLLGYIRLWLPQSKKFQSKTGQVPTLEKLSKVRSALPTSDRPSSVTAAIHLTLLHLTYLTMADRKDGKELHGWMKSVLDDLENTVRQITTSEDTDSVSLPEEFSLLQSKKQSPSEIQAAGIQLILDHPKVRQYFLASLTGSQTMDNLPNCASLTNMITEMVVKLFDIVRQNQLKVEKSLEFFHNKILDGLKKLENCSDKVRQSSSHLVFRSLKCNVETQDAQKCVNLLASLLAVVKGSHVNNESIGEVLDTILGKLTKSDLGMIKIMSGTGDLLIACCYGNSEVLTPFFQRFPHISVSCSSASLKKLLRGEIDLELLSILIRHNPVLRDQFGQLLTTVAKEEVLKYLPLVSRYLQTSCCNQREVCGRLCTLFKTEIVAICGEGASPDDLVKICKQLVQRKAFSKKQATKLKEDLIATLETGMKFSRHHIELLDQLMCCQATEDSQQDKRRLVQICITCFAKLLAGKQSRESGTEDALLNIVSKFSEIDVAGLVGGWTEFDSVWPRFIKGSLKYLYLDKKMLTFLTHLVHGIYTDNSDNPVTIETITTMVMGHSSFLEVMFNEKNRECKEALIDLVTQLIELCPQACDSEHVQVFLGAYGATLTSEDQKILKLLQIYERNGVKFSNFRPYLWGEKAIEHHTLHKSLGPALLQQPTVSKVIGNVDKDKMQETILNFPLRRKLQCMDVQDASSYKSSPDCYDPCFLLPLFSHLLAPDSLVDCRQFVEQGCLSFVLSALSSHDENIRSASYHILDRYRVHLEVARFFEKEQIVYLMELLRNSLPSSKVKLAAIITLFLARAAKLMLKPDDYMYGIINNFLLLKPSLDILNVPEFYKLFNSSSLQYKVERAWILALMHDGMRETADYRIFEKRYTFKLLQSFYDSDTSDVESQLEILKILTAACRERGVALDLSQNHGLIVWVTEAVAKMTSKSTRHVGQIVELVHTLWFTVLGRQEFQMDKTVGKPALLKTVFTTQILSLLQTLLWYLRDAPVEIIGSHLRTLLSVLQHIQAKVDSVSEEEGKLPEIAQSLSHCDILLALYHTYRFIPSKIKAQSILQLLQGFGYGTSLLEQPKGGKSGKLKSSETADVEENEPVLQKDSKELEKMEVESSKNEQSVSDLRTDLVKILINWKPQKDCLKFTVDMAAVDMIMIQWLVCQLEAKMDYSLLTSCLNLIKDRVHGGESRQKQLVLLALSSSSEEANFILDGLLGLYSKLNVNGDSVGELNDSVVEETEEDEDGANILLNSVLMDVGRMMFGVSEQEVDNIGVEDGVAMTLSGTELRSVGLRKLFSSQTKGKAAEVPEQQPVKRRRSSQGKKMKDKRNKSVQEIDGEKEMEAMLEDEVDIDKLSINDQNDLPGKSRTPSKRKHSKEFSLADVSKTKLRRKSLTH